MFYKNHDCFGVPKSMHIYCRKLEKNKLEDTKRKIIKLITLPPNGFPPFLVFNYTFICICFHNQTLLSYNMSTSCEFCLKIFKLKFIHSFISEIHVSYGHLRCSVCWCDIFIYCNIIMKVVLVNTLKTRKEIHVRI